VVWNHGFAPGLLAATPLSRAVFRRSRLACSRPRAWWPREGATRRRWPLRRAHRQTQARGDGGPLADSHSHLPRLHGGVRPWLPPSLRAVRPPSALAPVAGPRPCSAARPVERLVNTIRFLAVDAVEKANSGNSGLPVGCAPLGHILFDDFLCFNPRNEPGLVRLRPFHARRRARLHAPLRTAPPCRVPRCHGELQISCDLICRLCV
jgi:hypothetical protein